MLLAMLVSMLIKISNAYNSVNNTATQTNSKLFITVYDCLKLFMELFLTVCVCSLLSMIV